MFLDLNVPWQENDESRRLSILKKLKESKFIIVHDMCLTIFGVY